MVFVSLFLLMTSTSPQSLSHSSHSSKYLLGLHCAFSSISLDGLEERNVLPLAILPPAFPLWRVRKCCIQRDFRSAALISAALTSACAAPRAADADADTRVASAFELGGAGVGSFAGGPFARGGPSFFGGGALASFAGGSFADGGPSAGGSSAGGSFGGGGPSAGGTSAGGGPSFFGGGALAFFAGGPFASGPVFPALATLAAGLAKVAHDNGGFLALATFAGGAAGVSSAARFATPGFAGGCFAFFGLGAKNSRIDNGSFLTDPSFALPAFSIVTRDVCTLERSMQATKFE